MNKTEIITTVNGNVEKLITIGEVKGNFINNGIIYLNAAYDVYAKLNEPELTEPEFTEFADSYIKKIKTRFGIISIIGYDHELSFKDFYIEPSLQIANSSSKPVNQQERNGVNIISLVNSSNQIYIQGPAGSGKSTLLKFVLANVIELEIKTVPVFISLKDFKAFCSADPVYSLYDYILKDLVTYGFPQKFVHFILKNRLVLLLLDGFDEIYAKDIEKRILFNHLEDFGKLYDSKIIITSRTKEYDFSNSAWKYFELKAFDNSQVYQFLDKQFNDDLKPKFLHAIKSKFLNDLNSVHNFTYENRNQTDDPQNDWGIDRALILKMEAPEVKNELMKMKQFPQIVTNPLSLSLLVLQYKKYNALPTTKGDLFDGLVRSMVNKWLTSEMSEFFKNRIEIDDAYELIYYIAFNSYKKEEIIITRRSLFIWISEFLSEKNFSHYIKADDIIKTIRTDLGLLTDFNDTEYKFIHLSIQEYLVAKYLARDNKHNMVFSEMIYLKKNWSNVTLFLSELLVQNENYKRQYAKAILEIGTLSPVINRRITQAIEKSMLENSKPCYGLVFYYLCIGVYYTIGERAIYSCQRLGHKILCRVYSGLQKRLLFTSSLLRFCQELEYVGKTLNSQVLKIDSLILQLYETYIEKREGLKDVEKVIIELENIGFNDFKADLLLLKKKIKKNNKEQILTGIKKILKARNLQPFEELAITEINILTLFLDLLETYLESFPDFGKDNNEYEIFFTNKANSQLPRLLPPIPDFLTSRDYFEKGSSVELTDPKLAMEYISRAIELNPTISFYYFNRGHTYRHQNLNEEAIRDFLSTERLNENYKNDANFQRWFGMLYRKVHQYDKAIERFDKAALANKSDRMSDRWFKAEDLMKTHQYKLAIQTLENLHKLYPDQHHFTYSLAYCLMLEGKFHEALNYVDSVIKNNYHLAESYFIRYYCKLEIGELFEVAHSLKGYIEKNRESGRLLVPLLIKFYQLQNDDEQFTITLHEAYRQNIISKDQIISVPISPGHIELKDLKSAYFMEDFILPNDYLLYRM